MRCVIMSRASRLDDWISFFYKRIKEYIPFLIVEMRRYNLTPEQVKQISKGVFDRVLKDINQQFT